MCYYYYHFCPLCKEYELAEEGGTKCKYGDYLYGIDGATSCGRMQNLVARLYHKSCYLRAGGTEARFNRVNDQLRYEVNEWLYTDHDSYPARQGGTKIFKNFCDDEAYCPGGTQYAPRNYKALVQQEAEWYDRDVESAMKRLKDLHE
jgi:hypothetical protein